MNFFYLPAIRADAVSNDNREATTRHARPYGVDHTPQDCAGWMRFGETGMEYAERSRVDEEIYDGTW